MPIASELVVKARHRSHLCRMLAHWCVRPEGDLIVRLLDRHRVAVESRCPEPLRDSSSARGIPCHDPLRSCQSNFLEGLETARIAGANVSHRPMVTIIAVM